MSLIKLSNVEYKYPDGVKALDNITLEICENERVAIIGPNGAGKSTLLLHLNGLIFPTKGKVEIGGEKITEKNAPKVRKRVGLVFQNPEDQIFALSVKEDIAFGPKNYGFPEDKVEQKVQEVIDFFGLRDYEDKPPQCLSVGEKKKVALAGVFAMEPEIICLDEPTANLDPKCKRELLGLLNKIATTGTTVLIATHDLEFAKAFANRFIVLNNGTLLFDGSLSSLNNNLIERIF